MGMYHTIPRRIALSGDGTIQRYNFEHSSINNMIYVDTSNRDALLFMCTKNHMVLVAFLFCISRSLNKAVTDNPKNGDSLLKGTMFVLRTKEQLTNKYSPYFRMFGREARYPSEIREDYDFILLNVICCV